MNCCNDFDVCEHGPGCPAGAVTLPPATVATAVRTCEAMGVCQHPERECAGACEQEHGAFLADSSYPQDPTAPVQGFQIEDLGRDNFVTCLLIAALSGATLGILYGAGRWAWQAYQAWAVLS